MIGRFSGANLRSIRNWYAGKNVPSAGHLIKLAQISSTVRAVVLGQIEKPGVRDGTLPQVMPTEKLVTINGTTKEKSARKVWAIEQVKTLGTLRASNLAQTWQVALRTARRDISDLMRDREIEFVGAKRNGNYRLTLK